MNTRTLSLLSSVIAHVAFVLSAAAQGTAFTYQGALQQTGAPATGLHDFEFRLFDAISGGAQQGGTVTVNDLGVTNGLFAVTLDFGASVFTGAGRFVQIGVRPGASTGAYTTLTPRQPMTSTPYAIRAAEASSLPAGAVSGAMLADAAVGAIKLGANAVSSDKIADGTITAADVNAASFNTTFWRSTGNAGTTPSGQFLGTTDNQPLEFKVNGQRALRVEPANTGFDGFSPNLIGGSPANVASNGVVGAVIGGGGSAAFPNRVGTDFATVVGGLGNTATGSASTAMGRQCTASGYDSTAMGERCTARGQASIALGTDARVNHNGSFVWSDRFSAGTSSADSEFSVYAAGGIRLVGKIQLGTGTSDYRQFQLGGGNSYGFLYGSYPIFGDGIHLGYNYYADDGSYTFVRPDGATSRLTCGYGFIQMAVNDVGRPPTLVRLVADTTGVRVTGTFNNASDRNAKQDFKPIDSATILDKVLRLPLSEWSYKEDAQTRHVGPMAQDFHAAFGIGTDEKHIAPLDEGGVAFAAIQGLHGKVEGRMQNAETRVQKLEAENAALKGRLEHLERLLEKLVKE